MTKRKASEWLWLIGLLLALMVYKAVGAYLKLDHATYAIGPDDPDSWLRLTLVRDWLAGGGWYDHAVYGSNVPYAPTVSPWTRPIDMVLAGLVWLQGASDAPLTTKLMRAALVMPILWVVLFVIGLKRALTRISDLPYTGLYLIAMIGTAPMMWNYFGTGNADHHALLAVLWVWAVGCLFVPGKWDGARMGVLLGVMLWVSPEALVLIGGIMVWLGARWAYEGGSLRMLRHTSIAFAVTVAVALLVERPAAEWGVPIYDSLSVVHLVLSVACAAMAVVLTRFKPGTICGRYVAGALAGGVVLAVMWALYPLFFKGPMAEVDPFILSDFLPRVTEAASVLKETLPSAMGLLLQPLIAILIALYSLQGGCALSKRDAATLLALLLVATALYLLQQRWYYYLYPLVVLAIAPWLASLCSARQSRGIYPGEWIADRPEEKQALVRTPLVIALLLCPLLLMLLGVDATDKRAKRADACERKARVFIQHGGLTKALGDTPRRLWVGTNLGTQVLFFTPHTIVASNYHREGQGIRYVWEAMKLKAPEALKAHLAERGIEALLVCPASLAPEDSYLMALQQGKKPLPGWLVELARPGKAAQESTPALYLVR